MTASRSGLAFPPGFLEDALRAPIPLPGLGPTDVRRALERLLEGAPGMRAGAEAALSSAAGLIHGCETLLGILHELLDPARSPARLRDAVRDILRLFHVLLEHAKSSYAIEQAAGGVEAALAAAGQSAAPLPRPRRLKGYLALLEDRLAAQGVARRMDPERLGRLLVHLDDLYDDAALVLQRLAGVASADVDLDEGLRRLPEFLRRLYRDFVRGTIHDHIRPLDAPRGAGEKRQGEEERERPAGAPLTLLLRELEEAYDAI